MIRIVYRFPFVAYTQRESSTIFDSYHLCIMTRMLRTGKCNVVFILIWFLASCTFTKLPTFAYLSLINAIFCGVNFWGLRDHSSKFALAATVLLPVSRHEKTGRYW